jgi:hypothetical protein
MIYQHATTAVHHPMFTCKNDLLSVIISDNKKINPLSQVG